MAWLKSPEDAKESPPQADKKCGWQKMALFRKITCSVTVHRKFYKKFKMLK